MDARRNSLVSRVMNWLRVIIRILCWLLVLWQISINIEEHLRGSTTVRVSKNTPSGLPVPPVALCPQPSYDPRRLASLGFSIQGMSFGQLHNQMLDLDFIPDNVTLANLIQTAAWEFSDVIEALHIEDINGTIVSSIVSSEMWELVLFPWGPCFIVKLPSLRPGEVLSIRRHSAMKAECSWWQNGQIHFYHPRDSCMHVREYCNVSCGWAEYVARHVSVSVILLDSADGYSYNYLFPINLWWIGDILLEPYETTVLKMTNAPLSSHECLFLCYQSFMARSKGKNFECIIPSSIFSNELVKYMCKPRITTGRISSEDYLDFMEYCYSKCARKIHQRNWSIKEMKIHAQNTLSIRLQSHIKYFEEQEIYPLSFMLTSIGGNLGLLVGISFFNIWNVIDSFTSLTLLKSLVKRKCESFVSFFVSWYNHLRAKSNHPLAHVPPTEVHESGDNTNAKSVWWSLGYYGLLLVLLGIAAVHTCVIIQNLMSRSNNTGVRLKCLNRNEILNDDAEEHSAITKSLIAGQVAARAFGCRLNSSSPYQLCLLSCSLSSAASSNANILPYVNVDDLPHCETVSGTQNYMYVLQNDIQAFISQSSSRECRTKCKTQVSSDGINGTISNDNSCLEYSLTRNPQVSVELIFYNVGSIVSLYLGFCMLTFLKYGENLLINRQISYHVKNILQIMFIAFKVTVLLTGVALCISRISIYFFDRPIMTQMSSQIRNTQMMPKVTLCQWPPSNIEHIFDRMDNVTMGQYWNYDSETQQRLLTNLLVSDPEILNYLWKTTTDNIINKFRFNDAHHPVCYSWEDFIMYGSCCSIRFAFEKFMHKDVEYRFYAPFISQNESNRLYFIIHYDDSIPLLNDYLHSSRAFKNALDVSIESVAKYKGIDGSGKYYGLCIQKCLHSTIQRQLQQDPLNGSSTFTLGSLTHARLVLSMLLRSHNISENLHCELFMEKQLGQCKASCSNKERTYLSIIESPNEMSQRKSLVGHTMYFWILDQSSERCRIAVTLKNKLYEVIEDYDGYPLDHMLSDLGGLIGVTAGWSLLSLLLALTHYITSVSETGSMYSLCDQHREPGR